MINSSRRQFLLTFLFSVIFASPVFANNPDDVSIASANTGNNAAGGTTITGSYYTASSTRVLVCNLFPVDATGNRGTQISSQTMSAKIGGGNFSFSTGTLPTGNYSADVYLMYSVKGVQYITASDDTNFSIP